MYPSKFKFKSTIIFLCFVQILAIKPGHFTSTENNQDQNFSSNDTKSETDDAKELVKNFLLKKLDWSYKPVELVKDTKVPTILLDIFEKTTSSFNKKNRIVLPNNSNTIRNHPIVKQGQSKRKPKSKANKTGFVLRFNLTLSSKEVLNAGELRMYLERDNQCSSKKQRITMNQIVHLLANSKKRENHYTTIQEENNLIYRQIDTLVINYDKPTWIQFDVLPAVESWSKNSSSNYGLLIKSFCVDKNEFNLNENKFIDNFVVQPNSDVMDNFQTSEWNYFGPSLLTYSNHPTIADDYNDLDSLSLMNKTKREVDQRDGQDDLEGDWTTGKNKSCSRYSMYVDFKALGLDNFIVAPRGYDAYLCYGECSLSVVRGSNSSNHATTQSLTNKIQPDLVPPPCCVPTEFAPLAMIMYDEGETSVLKLYENMIVTKCGCR